MGIKVEHNGYQLGNNLTEFFSIPLEDEVNSEEFPRLKDKIYKLDIDPEEKANIINVISKLSIVNSIKEKNKITKEIEDFIKKYNL